MIRAETDKIDSAAIDGLLGTENSLGYIVQLIDKHIHNVDRWLGEHSSRSLEDDCGEIDTMTVFQTDAGNDGYGAAVCVIGRNDVPIVSGGVMYGAHHLAVVDVESTADLKIHKVQVVYGNGTFAAALAAGQYTDAPPFVPLRGAAFTYVDINIIRLLSGSDKVWVRHWVDGVDTGTMNFFMGLHEYPQYTTAIPTTTTTTTSSTTTTTSTSSSTSSTSSTASTTSSTSSTASTTSTTHTTSSSSTTTTTSP